MKIELESTHKLVHLNGVPARIWEGKTARGVPVHAFITRIACDHEADSFEFDLELDEHRPPSPEVDRSYPDRMTL